MVASSGRSRRSRQRAVYTPAKPPPKIRICFLVVLIATSSTVSMLRLPFLVPGRDRLRCGNRTKILAAAPPNGSISYRGREHHPESQDEIELMSRSPVNSFHEPVQRGASREYQT